MLVREKCRAEEKRQKINRQTQHQIEMIKIKEAEEVEDGQEEEEEEEKTKIEEKQNWKYIKKCINK